MSFDNKRPLFVFIRSAVDPSTFIRRGNVYSALLTMDFGSTVGNLCDSLIAYRYHGDEYRIWRLLQVNWCVIIVSFSFLVCPEVI